MALWANSSDGWGSDASKSGNGNLGTYLQTSLASAPQSKSLTQAKDPSNAMPTASVSRMAQPSASRAVVPSRSGTSGGLMTPAGQPVAQVDYSGVAQPTYAGPEYVQYTGTFDHPIFYGAGGVPAGKPASSTSQSTFYLKWDAQSGQYKLVGRTDRPVWDGKVADAATSYGQTAANTGLTYENVMGPASSAGGVNYVPFENVSQYVNSQYADQIGTYNSVYGAAKDAAKSEQLKKYYADYLTQNGKLPDAGFGSHGLVGHGPTSIDAQARAAALGEYNQNVESAAAIGKGISPIDMSQQNAINQASMASLASSYATNLGKGEIANVARMYSTAAVGQTGVNRQLSDEAYAEGFNRNLAVFNQAVQNQATLDTNATTQKLNLDVQAVSDTLAKLQQQISQTNTSASQKVNQQLINVQKEINDYRAKAAAYAADSQESMNYLKLALGAAVGISSIALAPLTAGASLGGVAAGAAIATS